MCRARTRQAYRHRFRRSREHASAPLRLRYAQSSRASRHCANQVHLPDSLLEHALPASIARAASILGGRNPASPWLPSRRSDTPSRRSRRARHEDPRRCPGTWRRFQQRHDAKLHACLQDARISSRRVTIISPHTREYWPAERQEQGFDAQFRSERYPDKNKPGCCSSKFYQIITLYNASNCCKSGCSCWIARCGRLTRAKVPDATARREK
jgi:hypothetical protein